MESGSRCSVVRPVHSVIAADFTLRLLSAGDLQRGIRGLVLGGSHHVVVTVI
jgi:hypothetical protein